MECWGTIKAGSEQWIPGSGLPVSITIHPLAWCLMICLGLFCF